MKQFQMQVSVLQQLRKTESKRRSEASVENIQLRLSFNESIQNVKDLQNVS